MSGVYDFLDFKWRWEVRDMIETYTKSLESIMSDCEDWAKEIDETYQVDLIIFIAKSGFLFAKPLAEYFNCAMVDILVSRPASKIKDKLKWIIKFIPDSIIFTILKMPLMYKFNNRNKERNIKVSERFEKEKQRAHKKILIVDDSVDTGWTLQYVYEIVKESFPEAIIKTAAYAVIDYSKDKISVDYYRYRNTIVLTATSRKSAQYGMFLKQYEAWITGQ